MNTCDLAEIWVNFNDKCKNSISRGIFDAWIKPLQPLEITDTYCKVGVKNNFYKKILEEKYAAIIESILSEIMGKPIALHLEILEKPAQPETPEKQPSYPVQQPLFHVKPLPELQVKEDFSSNLNGKYTFENFVIGNSNRFPYNAAHAVAEHPGSYYNPLFLYGGVGLGKTHLMHAIGNYIKKNNPQMKVLYVSSEKFTNEIVNSIYNKTTEGFRRKYRNIDCLIVDDIQFLKGKEQTQLEFFHTFNTLREAGKQIVIASDRKPKEIETLEERLRTRFESGLPAEILTPDLETRMAILRQKAANDNIDLPYDVLTLIATNIVTNIREIEGAYTKMAAYSSLMNIPINMEMAKKILNEMGPVKNQINFENITKTVAEYYHIKTDDLFAKKRTQNIAFPRQVAMYLCRELADMSYPRIGELFGGRDHTTVMHAYEKINKNKKNDFKLQNDLQALTDSLNQ